MKIVLLGYMGSGKSTIASTLGASLGLNKIDLDEYIEEKQNSSIKEIFSSKGEIYFRKIEHDYLNELLDNDDEFILALGGGTPCYSNNTETITNKSISIYLKCGIETLYNRLLSEKQDRPIIASLENDKLKEFIGKHLFERAPFYEQADHIIQIDTKSIEEIAIEIKQLI